VEFRVLGTLEVLDNGGQPVELRGNKLRTLLAALLLSAGQPVSADRLADLLWGESPPSGAVNALQAQISKLRRLLVDAPLEGRDGGYALAIDPGQIDSEQFTRLAEAGHDHLIAGRHVDAAGVLREALVLWRGPAFADFAFDDFAQAARMRLEEMRLTATEDRIDADLQAGRHEAVAAELEGLVHEHPLRERMWGQLMVALYRCDRQSDSLRAFQRAREMLADELGLEPGPALRELERQVLNQDPALDAPAGAAKPSPGLSNIHPEFSTFVGRRVEVEQILGHLSNRRLVSISGPGGVGKTRLATEVALHRDRVWRDGTWLVELGLDSGERAVSAAFQRTFGPRLGHTASEDALDWLTTGLATTELLIVLDNCEHVLAEAAVAASAIVRSCPGVTVLATSREPLGLSGERVVALQPLELDDAVSLFASRAADSDEEFVLDDSSLSAVTAICTRVDRLPLAIELTAARTRAFSAHQLADLLDQRFGLVGTAQGGRPQRQQNMHAAVDWSFELLFDDERRLLTRLSVFAGSFDLDAAIKVCADADLGAADVGALMARLVDKSLVAAEKASGGTQFRLLRPVAEYATERLDDAGETETFRIRHSDWLIDLTAGLTAGLRGPDRLTWAHLVNTQLANLARAAEWGLVGGDPADALQIGVNLGWYAFLSGNISNDEPLLLALLERASYAPATLRCRALMWSGLLSIGHTGRRTWAMDAVDVARTAARTGRSGVATSHVDGIAITKEAIGLARFANDPALLLEALSIGSLHFAAVGSLPDELRAMNEEAAALAEAAGDAWYIAMVSALRGMADYVAGDLDTSMATLREAIHGFRRLGDEATAGLFEISLSEVAELRGEISEATEAMARALAVESECGFRSSTILRAVLCWLAGRNGEGQRALDLGREVVALAHKPFNPVVRAQALFALGVAESIAELPEAAAEHLQEALRIHEQVGMVREAAMDHRHLGELLHRQGDSAAALVHHRRALQLAVQVGLPWTVMLAARSMARTIVDDDPQLASQLLGNTEALSELFGYTPTPDERRLVEEVRATATERAGPAAVAEATAAGAILDYRELPHLVG